MPIWFDEPRWLILLLLLVPVWVLARRAVGAVSRTKLVLSVTLRTLLVMLLAAALARPSLVRRGEGLTVTILLDRSQSIPYRLREEAVSFLRAAAERKERPEDRVAVLTLARDATITAMADPYSSVTIGADEADTTATNLALAVRRALSIMPDDTANRIVLASDGNETDESVLAAAELARANGVPIDIVPLAYEHEGEVIFEQIVAPPSARQGQTADVKLVLRSQRATTGTVRLEVNGVPMDLDPAALGDGLAVELRPGVNAIAQTLSLDESGAHEFRATFTPDDASADAVERNNEALAVTFVAGAGRVLVIEGGGGASSELVRAGRESGIGVDVMAPEALSGGLAVLSAYDAIVLVNTPRWSIDDSQDRMLHAYVHDLGGGLVMIGGPESFGAGGWIDSQVARVLPVKLNPPDTRQMPAGALALIMHSCEMPQGNFWGQKVAESAIEALSRLDYAGIVEFSWGGGADRGGIEGCSWAYPMQRLGDKQAALQATKTMQVGDMPAFGPSMQLALNGLVSVPAAQRHAIIISDGDPSPPSKTLIGQYQDNRVTVTTVMVGGHGTAVDRTAMQAVAESTGGNFYSVTNPKQLPQIFIKEAQIVSRSLIQDGDTFAPQVVSSLPGPTQGYEAVPTIDGYVLTAPREGLAQTPIVIATSEANDPLLAHWNYGIGRSIAYTSDLSSRWGASWASWRQFRAFWEQSLRWAMRPSAPSNMLVSTRIESGVATVEVEALEGDASFMNFLRTRASVVRPGAADGEALRLEQTGPGRYRASFPAREQGAYVVNIGYEEPGATGMQFLRAAVTVPYAREFRTVRDDGAKLEEIRTLTGGRTIPLGDAATADLFDAGDLAVPRTARRIWDMVAMICAALLVLDVAARRLSVDPERARALARGAVGRRQEVGSGTVAAWKRTRASVAQQRGAEPRRAPDRKDAAARFDASEADAGRAIDVGAAESGASTPSPDAPPAAPSRSPAEPEEDDASTMARLLAARRRARGGDDE